MKQSKKQRERLNGILRTLDTPRQHRLDTHKQARIAAVGLALCIVLLFFLAARM